jgi:regulator of RNase E activity RraA
MKLLGLIFVILSAAALQDTGNAFTSSDAADATERLTGRRAHMGDEIRQLSGTTLTGRAITLRIVRDDTASSTAEGLKVIRQMESAPPASVIVATVEGDKAFAVFGATFATLSKSRQLGGFVIDGSMRGVSDFRTLGVPMFARGTVAGSAGGHFRLDAANVPIVCGGIDVSPGDYVIGDADGIAIVPSNRHAEIFARAMELRNEKSTLLPLIMRYRSYTQAVEAYAAQKKRKP